MKLEIEDIAQTKKLGEHNLKMKALVEEGIDALLDAYQDSVNRLIAYSVENKITAQMDIPNTLLATFLIQIMPINAKIKGVPLREYFDKFGGTLSNAFNFLDHEKEKKH